MSTAFFSFVMVSFFSNIISLIHLPFQLLLIVMTIPFVILWSITSYRIVFALLHKEVIRILKWVGHKANFKVEFLQTCHQISHFDVLKWNYESWKIIGFLISLSLFLYGAYRKNIEGIHFDSFELLKDVFISFKNLLFGFGLFNIIDFMLVLEDSVDGWRKSRKLMIWNREGKWKLSKYIKPRYFRSRVLGIF